MRGRFTLAIGYEVWALLEGLFGVLKKKETPEAGTSSDGVHGVAFLAPRAFLDGPLAKEHHPPSALRPPKIKDRTLPGPMHSGLKANGKCTKTKSMYGLASP